MSTVKQHIDNNLDPGKHDILNPLKEDFEETPSIKSIFAELGIAEDQYYNALSISSDSDFQVHIKREPNACFVNNFFTEGLQAWKANIDTQPVFNHYKAVTYMCTNFSKAEDETSEAMKQAAREALAGTKSDYEKMKAILELLKHTKYIPIQNLVENTKMKNVDIILENFLLSAP